MSDIRDQYDVAVIGAGPAGLAAATVAAKAGASTVVFDEQPVPGGQIYRAIGETPLRDRGVLGPDYWQGQKLVEGFQASGATYAPGSTVWTVSARRELGVSRVGRSRIVAAKRVVIATGALERPFPIPGWTLPGVMTVGAGQIMLKTGGFVPSGRVVLAGCGPLLWLIAWQYLNVGFMPDLILDTTRRENRLAALPYAPAFLASSYFVKGLRLMAAVRRKVRIVSGVTELAAQGGGRVQSVRWRAGDVAGEQPTDLLLLHQGVVPDINLAVAAGIAQRWDDTQLCWQPVMDKDFRTSLEGVFVAGDGAGIAGADAARQRGRIAGIAAVTEVLPGIRDALAAELNVARAQLVRYTRGRPFLDTLYKPAKQFRVPQNDVLACRCEEVTAGAIRSAAAHGCPGPNQLKIFLRAGMGPCQGRMCGLTVTELLADAHGQSPAAIGHYRLRPPVKPITVGELASLPKDEESVTAVLGRSWS